MSDLAGKVTIEILRGKDLVAMDKPIIGKPSSDPYVKVYRPGGTKVGKTDVVHKSLNPEWQHTLSFNISEAEAKTIHLEVYDHDTCSENDPMGMCEINLLALTDGIRAVAWHPLKQSARGGKFSGEIEVAVTFTHRKVMVLEKGQQFCPEEVPSTVCVGLAWDCFGTKVDLDASAVFFDTAGKVVDSLYFGNRIAFGGAAEHKGDSRTGEEGIGDEDDEQIMLHLHRLPQNVLAVVFVVTAYSENATFSDVEVARFRLVDTVAGYELCRFPVHSRGPHTSLVMCRLARVSGFWNLNAIGDIGPPCHDYGAMLPEIKGYMKDLVPSISIAENDRVCLLRKGNSVDLSAMSSEPLTTVAMGLGWDMAGLSSIDLDASCIMMTADAQVTEIVSFSHLKSSNQSVKHSGDNTSGKGQGDDETITVNLQQLPSNVEYLFFIVNSYSGEKFTHVQNTKCRLYVPATKRELAVFELTSSDYHCTGLLMTMVKREGDSWIMKAVGEGCTERVASGCVDEVQEYVRTGALRRRW